jgi:hypothetical protein
MLLAAIILAGVSLVPHRAYAGGTVSVTNLSPTESNGRWKFVMSINYGSTPHIGHVPMIFTFTPTVLYERALTDQSGDRPILNRIPLQNQQTINESMDVAFSNAEGKIFATTKFDFSLSRDRGFEAGEYKLEIKREDDGARMGNVMTIKLIGDNPIVDRRAITFAGEKKKEKKADDAAKTDGEKKADAPAEPAAEPAAEPGAATDAEGASAPPPVPPKQGGCGCRVIASSSDDGLQALAALALGAGIVMRRARRRS